MDDAGTPLPVPLRVVVMGASASLDTSFHGGPRADVAYPRVVEAALWASGQPARVRVSALQAHRPRHGLRAWPRDVECWCPDVVVLHYGQADSVHRVLPRWLERHANSTRGRPGALRQAYRRAVLRPTWLALIKLQTRLDVTPDATVDATPDATKVTRRQRQVTAELARLIDLTRSAASSPPPLVLVPTLVRPGPPWQRWFPGAAARMATLNGTFAEVVRQVDDPDVRTFPLAELVEQVVPEGEEPTPDGGHFTPLVHHAIGVAMAQLILEWVDRQPRPAAGAGHYGGRHADL
jgi:lysophospholipase L1-like esterase